MRKTKLAGVLLFALSIAISALAWPRDALAHKRYAELSRYKYQDGLAYYESTKDTASHFFIDYLPKGVYVFEHSTRIQLKGTYQTGVSSIQCMYASEFNSHSESFSLEVR